MDAAASCDAAAVGRSGTAPRAALGELDMTMLATLSDTELYGERPVATIPQLPTVQSASIRNQVERSKETSTTDVGAVTYVSIDEGIFPRSNDELLLRAVLQRRPYAKATHSKKTAWDDVANAFVPVGGVDNGGGATREDVTQRLGVLTLTLLEHPQLLTPALRAMVLDFHECNCKAGFARQLGVAFLETLRKNAAFAGDRSKTLTVMQEVSSAVARAVPDAKADGFRKRAVRDEHLLRLVMHFRPFDADKKEGKTAVWTKVVEAFNATVVDNEGDGSDVLTSASSVINCVRMATAALMDYVSPYRAFFSPSLRAMLLECNMLSYSSRSPLLDRPGEAMPMQGATTRGSQRIDAERDEVFMRIVLEKKPFNAKRGGKMKTWDVIDAAFQAACDDRFLLSGGGSGVERLKFLTKAMVDRPRAVPRVVRGMLLEYYELLCQSSSKLAKHEELLTVLRGNVRKADADDDEGDSGTVGCDDDVGENMNDDGTSRVCSSREGSLPRSTLETSNDPAQDTARNGGTTDRSQDSEVVQAPVVAESAGFPGLPVLATTQHENESANSSLGLVSNTCDDSQLVDGGVQKQIGDKTSDHARHVASATESTKRKAPQPIESSQRTRNTTSGSEDDNDARSKRCRLVEGNAATNDGRSKEHTTTRDEIPFQVALRFRAAGMLRYDAWDAVAAEVNEQLACLGQAAFAGARDVRIHVQRVLKRLETKPESLSGRLRELAAQYIAVDRPSTNRESVQPVSVAQSSSPAPRCSEMPQPSVAEEDELALIPDDTRTSSNDTSRNPLEAEVVALRAEVKALREALAAQVTEKVEPSIPAASIARDQASELASAHAEIASLMHQYEQERRAFRMQLQAEREEQLQETRELLEALDRERQARQDERVAMTALIKVQHAPF